MKITFGKKSFSFIINLFHLVLDQIEVSLDIHILSWPVSRAFNDRMDSVLPSPRSNDVSPFIANKTLNAFDFDNISVTSSSIMTELPQLVNFTLV